MAPRHFDLQQANALIPRIRSTMTQALQLHALMRQRLRDLQDGGSEVTWAVLRGESEPEGLAPDERDELQRSRLLYQALRELLSELEDEGIQVRSVAEGLVDFPSWRDGRTEVCLCWKVGEDQVRHYHSLEAGFAGRKTTDGVRFTRTKENLAGDRRPDPIKRSPREPQ